MRFYGATTSQLLRASSHSLSLSFGQPAPSRGSHDGRHDGEPRLPRSEGAYNGVPTMGYAVRGRQEWRPYDGGYAPRAKHSF